MSDERSSGWGRVVEELKNPWDWAAALVGGAGGGVVTVLVHGLDLGHSALSGALGAIGVRRAAVASLRGRELRNTAERLIDILQRDGYSDLVLELKGEREKWQAKITSSDLFDRKIGEISQEHSRRQRTKLSGPQAYAALPPP